MSQTTDTLPNRLYSAAQVRELDARLIAAGTPGFELMQRAAHAALVEGMGENALWNRY